MAASLQKVQWSLWPVIPAFRALLAPGTHLENIPFRELEAVSLEAYALAGLCLYPVDALMVIVIVGREVGGQQRALVPLDTGTTFR